ncbi:PSD1 and planctomycete cytochrome C domain-containing protein [Schlesneria paludicola]|uniref:PSD1 and planctomycete cytochrome C domain-containing protein n=1 Tax=Schlesneria paludicola TaxID=360056 RepID=UPI00029B2E8A|nr:PSD1 and planctomycete cytochrome C domain-containing protein [Schlesneria paludicola]
MLSRTTILGTICLLTTITSDVVAQSRTIDFDRDVRPILSAHCAHCHGPDQGTREANLRLDTRAGLFGQSEGGGHVIVPKSLDQSELYRRISTTDATTRMPPLDGGKPLSEEQITTLRLWIEQGAAWRGHWANEPIARPAVPSVEPASVDNPIDAFLIARWNRTALSSAVEADRVTLARRISFDLTGLPPLELDPVASGPDWYQREVDRLLSSPRFGERMAVYWLDLVRYGDSCGYHSDNDQQISPYRDYVIGAFNRNLAFDQFTREQLAGDLLPNPTLDQQIATGFNRLSKSTEEGGAQEKEYLAKAFGDRVRTVSGVWLAATLGCAECHDHKYDPLSARDFYNLGAFFADIQERGVYSGGGRRDPELSLPTKEQADELNRLKEELENAKERRQATTTSGQVADPDLETEIKQLEKKRKDLEGRIARTLVTVSVSPRQIRILPRGDWQSETGEVVEPSVPAVFAAANVAGRRQTRLDLAEWLMQRENPRTARVFVNRIWKLYFGTGLAKNLDDLGAQGESPVHPELLDWLASEFIDSGWDVKRLVRTMVTSHAYQLSSIPTPEQLRIDPKNRLHARQSRWRLDAEFLRDNALSVSGLLVERLGGPSVKPYQPDGYWEFLNFPKRTWQASSGSNQYRRGLYTHWQRTFLHPALLAFDAPSREECTADRVPSNTPKSALALLNDPSMVEAAREFAVRIINEGGSADNDRIQWAWRIALSRKPDAYESAAIANLLTANRSRYQADDAAAIALQTVGQPSVPPASSSAEWAAWTSVARAIFNLHEFTTRN